jgi:DNA-binding Lrp family transcriptional regulator
MQRLLAFVDIFVESPYMDEVVQELQKLPNMEELYEVTGEFDIVSLVSAADIEEFRDILKNKIMKIRGVKSTVTSVVLHSHKGPRLANNGSPKMSRPISAAVTSATVTSLR